MKRALVPAVFIALGVAVNGCSDRETRDEGMQERHEVSQDSFWQIIGEVRNGVASPEERPGALEKRLARMAAPSIQAFDNMYHQQLAKAYRWDLWGAVYLIHGGCSDDGFRYFRDSLISEGREVFEQALRDPDSLASFEFDDEAELESFGYAASTAYEQVAGREMPYPETPRVEDPEGKEWTEDDLGSMFPKLAKKYGWGT